MNATASAKSKAKSNGSSSRRKTARSLRIAYVVCIDDGGYEGDLLPWKIYRVLPDREGAKVNYIRAIDETGEDYLYSAERFFPIGLPPALRRRIPKSTIA